MSGFLDRWLGLHNLSTGDAGVEFQLAHPWPAWAWALAVVACIAGAGWSYWHLLGSRGARAALAATRAALLLLVAFLIAGPELVKQNERVEPDWIVVMADRSASMRVADVDTTSGPRATRETQLRDALAGAANELTALESTRRVLYLGFDAGVYDLPRTPAGPTLSPPEGLRTAIGQSLDQVLKRVAAKPVAGVVLLSDGRSLDQPSPDLLRQLAARQITVSVVPLGAAGEIADFAVARVETPASAFVGDIVPVNVEVERRGGAGGGAKIRLLDRTSREVLDERRLEPGATGSTMVTLATRRAEAGRADWRVEVVPDQPDLSAENNAADTGSDVVDRAIRVVYIDGYPRWEYRYLKNLLVREKSIRSAGLLLAADRRYIQEGTEPLGAVPRTQAEWNAIDVLILGDIRPSLLSEEQLAQIRTMVAERGAGVLWIGGPLYTPNGWRGTPGADLLPFSLGADGGSREGGVPLWSTGVMLTPGPAADRYGLLQLGDKPGDAWPAELSEASLGWPVLRWAQRVDAARLKPTTEVLGLARPVGNPSDALPLVMTMRYGAGRVAYVATDETWRFRYGRGEELSERLWIPLIRLLARESLARTGKAAILRVDPERVEAGQAAQVTLRLVDQSLIEKRPTSVTVRVVRPGSSTPVGTVTLRPEGTEDGAPAVTMTGVWHAREPGLFKLEGADALTEGLGLEARVEVTLPEDELRRPQADHPALEALAKATGGEVLAPDQLAQALTRLPNRQLRILGTPDRETLWDKPLVWCLLIVLMGLEWAGRRLIKLP